MRRYTHLRGLITASLVALACLVFARPEPNSFIERICNSPEALVAHAKSDKRVMDRYSRHFAMTSAEVVDYLGSLRLSATKEEALYTVYAAPDTTPLRSKVLKVKKGTKVFVDGANNIVLLWHCGNPVTRGPKNPLSAADLAADPKGEVANELRLVPTQSASVLMNQTVEMPSEPGTPEIPVIPVQESDIPIVSAAQVPGWIGLIPALGLITGRDGKDNPPVPEPATILVLGTAVAYAVRRKRTQNR